MSRDSPEIFYDTTHSYSSLSSSVVSSHDSSSFPGPSSSLLVLERGDGWLGSEDGLLSLCSLGAVLASVNALSIASQYSL